jgi:hypothetical protein
MKATLNNALRAGRSASVWRAEIPTALCRVLAISTWISTLPFLYFGFLLSWGLPQAAMLLWSFPALPLVWLTVRWLRRSGAPWTSSERAWVVNSWVALAILLAPLLLLPDHPIWDGIEWIFIIPAPAYGAFPIAVTAWAIGRAVKLQSVSSRMG